MYRIPDDLDLNDIVNSEIQQICLGRYDVQFHFASGTIVAVQGDVTLLDGDKVIGTWNEAGNWTSLGFQQLLNVAVTGYSVVNDRLLQINFASGLILHLHDYSDQYESFQIYPKDKDQIIVV